MLAKPNAAKDFGVSTRFEYFVHSSYKLIMDFTISLDKIHGKHAYAQVTGYCLPK